MDDLDRFLRMHERLTRYACRLAHRDIGADGLERLITAELRLLHELATEAFGPEKAADMVRVIAT